MMVPGVGTTFRGNGYAAVAQSARTPNKTMLPKPTQGSQKKAKSFVGGQGSTKGPSTGPGVTTNSGYAARDALQLWSRSKIQYGALVVGRMLGKGSFGDVYEGEFKKYPGRAVAVKQLKQQKAGDEKARYAVL